MSERAKMSLYDSMLFNYETTYRTDYREVKLPPTVKTYKEKPKRKREPTKPTKFVGNMVDWKHPISFDTMLKPKDILQTNPTTPQEVYEKSKDLDREQVQRMRPRLTITPAISVDDVTDPVKRDIIIRDIYATEASTMMQDAAAPYTSVKSPLRALPAPADPLYFPKLREPYVSKEWRTDSIFWDRRQKRVYVDPAREFWTRKDPTSTSCGPCCASAIVAANRKKLR